LIHACLGSTVVLSTSSTAIRLSGVRFALPQPSVVIPFEFLSNSTGYDVLRDGFEL
jgi:hypothetical protein